MFFFSVQESDSTVPPFCPFFNLTFFYFHFRFEISRVLICSWLSSASFAVVPLWFFPVSSLHRCNLSHATHQNIPNISCLLMQYTLASLCGHFLKLKKTVTTEVYFLSRVMRMALRQGWTFKQLDYQLLSLLYFLTLKLKVMELFMDCWRLPNPLLLYNKDSRTIVPSNWRPLIEDWIAARMLSVVKACIGHETLFIFDVTLFQRCKKCIRY